MIKLYLTSIVCSFAFFISCQRAEIKQDDLTTKTVNIPEISNSSDEVRIYDPAVASIIEKSTEERPIHRQSKNHYFKKEIIKDSATGEYKIKHTLDDRIIDSLNSIIPIFNVSMFEEKTVSYFSSLASSLHGKSFFAEHADSVVPSIMNILSTRLDEGTDIVFLIDKTGSMADDIAAVKNSLEHIMSYLEKFSNVKVAVAFYGDKNYHYDLWYNRTDLTQNVDELRQLMNTYEVIGNPDTPESVNDAIVKTVTEMNWTKGNRRLIMVIGDAYSQSPPLSAFSEQEVIRTCDSLQVKFNLYPIILATSSNTWADKDFKKDFVKVYPNPASEECHLKFNSAETYYYELHDLNGRNILSSNLNGDIIHINLNTIPSGSYLLQIYNKDFSKYYSKPIIIQH